MARDLFIDQPMVDTGTGKAVFAIVTCSLRLEVDLDVVLGRITLQICKPFANRLIFSVVSCISGFSRLAPVESFLALYYFVSIRP
jgi:hypothetical protein